MMEIKNLISDLNKKGYEIEIHNHDPLFTVEESKKLRGNIRGAHSKNLFLKNKKNNFFLISLMEDDQINLKKISKLLNLGNISFAKEKYLDQLLGVKPGSVSPFALLNNMENNIKFFLEKKLYDSEYLNFHPLTNSITITIRTNKFIEFMIEKRKKIHIFSDIEGIVYKKYE